MKANLNIRALRRKYLTKPIYNWAQKALPKMSDTEREALEAGEIWWDAELFSGKPEWSKLLKTKPPKLNKEEQAFINGPVEKLLTMINDWDITWQEGDLPKEVWDYIKKERFFGMIIPKKYGGLGFSAYAHSEVIRKIATASVSTAVTIMVPNSLGPGELLMQYGTDEQRKYWLERLAKGQEIPAFALTSAKAGSDAAAMQDEGIVCKQEWLGKKVTGIRLNWNKRYITLGPICTVLGLAFKLKDPDNLLKHEKGKNIGITVALIPTDLDGITIGNRHLPTFQMFQNGPNQGKNVFIPMEYIIGGQEKIGKGWAMLMGALAAGRGISLPSLSAAGTAFAAHTAGAYASIREQFKIPIGKFEGIQEVLGKMAGRAYLVDAARKLTCAGLDEGRKLAVISGIMKAHATERMRNSINDAMDIHGGKAIIDGPLNYLGGLYRSIPVGITVEGANILTRNLIIFGQGSIRCHPYIIKEMEALKVENKGRGLTQFDAVFWKHVAHSTKNLLRSWLHSWTGGVIASTPKTKKTRKYYKQLSRYAALFSFTADMALLTLGGTLKRKEMLSARLGDILSELYLLTAALKRFEDDKQPEADLPIVELCMQEGLATMQNRLDEIFDNLPNRPVAWLLQIISLSPVKTRGATDKLKKQCAEILLTPSDTRNRLTENIFGGNNDDGLTRLNTAFKLASETSTISKKMRNAKIKDWRQAKAQKIITHTEAKKMEKLETAIEKAIEVDDFLPNAFSRSQKQHTHTSIPKQKVS